MRVELIYDNDCPNVAPTRANLLRAFAATGTPAKWTERSSPDTPAEARQFGSPAILVNGMDIAGYAPNGGTGLSPLPTRPMLERHRVFAR